jgi:hypothetical protein
MLGFSHASNRGSQAIPRRPGRTTFPSCRRTQAVSCRCHLGNGTDLRTLPDTGRLNIQPLILLVFWPASSGTLNGYREKVDFTVHFHFQP